MANRVKIIDEATGKVKWAEAGDPIDADIQSALDGKVDDGQVLTNVPAGALFTDTNTQLSDAQVETAYNNQVGVVSQVDAEAGTSTTAERWTPERVKQAIDALGSGGTASDMAGLMLERTTDLALTDTFQEMTFDTTALENDATVLEHNNTNTERVDVKTSGLHQLVMSFDVENSANTTKVLNAELRVNGTMVKELSFTCSKSAEELVARILLDELVAGTYLTVAFKQQEVAGEDLTLKANSVVSIIKLQGTKGDKGDAGAGSNIIIQDNDVTVGTVTDTLNFEGSSITSVVDEGSNKTTITIDNSSGNKQSITGAATVDSNGVYVVERRFMYAGTNNDDAITAIKMNVFRQAGVGTYDVRVVRASDAAVICSSTGNANTDDADIVDLGAISNLPTEHTVLEIQGQVSNGSTSAFLGAVYFES